MSVLSGISPLWMDHYALTMSQALFDCGKHEVKTTFHLFPRNVPWSYFVVAGQEVLLSWLSPKWKFEKEDMDFLSAQGVFSGDFLSMLKNSRLDLTIDAMMEGEIAFAKEPVCRVTGPMWQCLAVEASLLNSFTSQSSFATNASQICESAGGQPVVEFGLRRCHSIGGLEASRGSYIGGCHSSSNLLAGRHYGIPVAGTCSHAFVMLYESELDAFKDYARVHRGDAPVFLVDTYSTKQGVLNAISVCQELGIELGGIRIDSGDLKSLSLFVKSALIEAGFGNAKVIASGNLNFHSISQIRKDSAVDLWGVGTSLTALGASIDFVYKLGAVHDNGETRPVMKFSDDREKMTLPGELDLLRFLDQNGNYLSDCIIPAGMEERDIVSVADHKVVFEKSHPRYKPLKTLLRNGNLVREVESLDVIRNRVRDGLRKLDSQNLTNRYTVGIEESLVKLQETMVK